MTHFLFARESSENLHTFAQFVNGSLRARQRKLRWLQAQCPATIFSEAERFRTELINSDLPVQPDVHFSRDLLALLSSCPACRVQHHPHTCGGDCILANVAVDNGKQRRISQQSKSNLNKKRSHEADRPYCIIDGRKIYMNAGVFPVRS